MRPVKFFLRLAVDENLNVQKINIMFSFVLIFITIFTWSISLCITLYFPVVWFCNFRAVTVAICLSFCMLLLTA